VSGSVGAMNNRKRISGSSAAILSAAFRNRGRCRRISSGRLPGRSPTVRPLPSAGLSTGISAIVSKSGCPTNSAGIPSASYTGFSNGKMTSILSTIRRMTFNRPGRLAHTWGPM